MSVAAEAKGFKRICTGCGTRFYDLNKRPIVCPKCQMEFTGEQKVKARRGRAAAEKAAEGQVSAKTRKAVENAPGDEDEIQSDLVSLEDVKKMEDGGDDTDGEEADLEDDDIEIDVVDEDDLEDDLDVKIDKD